MIVSTLVVLGVLVTIHEFGHFWVARCCGVKVLRFSIGFGSPLLRWRDKQGTEFVVAWLPLGGYVKMVDEREGEVGADLLPYAFNRKPVAARMAIVAAGPIANFVLAIFAFWIVYLIGVKGLAPIVDGVTEGSVAAEAGLRDGDEIVSVDGRPTPTWQTLGEALIHRFGDDGSITFSVQPRDSNMRYERSATLNDWDVDADDPDPVAALGITLFRPAMLPLVDSTTPGSPAARAGFESGDRVLSADGVKIEDWGAWVNYVRERPGQAMQVVVDRAGESVSLRVIPDGVEENGRTIGQVGMRAVQPDWPEDLFRESRYGPWAGLGKALAQTGSTVEMIFNSVIKMITGAISVEHLSGPITIAKVAGTSAQYGVVSFLQFMALLSVSLGVLNLLPVPVLDGGHLLYYAVEAIKGSPVSQRVQEAGYRFGLFFIVGLMLLALYNDINRL